MGNLSVKIVRDYGTIGPAQDILGECLQVPRKGRIGKAVQIRHVPNAVRRTCAAENHWPAQAGKV